MDYRTGQDIAAEADWWESECDRHEAERDLHDRHEPHEATKTISE